MLDNATGWNRVAQSSPLGGSQILPDSKLWYFSMYGHGAQHPVVAKLEELMKDPANHKLSASQAARTIGTSLSHLQHLLRKSQTRYGLELRKRRAETARTYLLRHPEKTIDQIATECNYEPQTMYRHFIAVFGRSPSAIRREAQHDHMRGLS
jgi:transcriptional regulator GlxA family with amidase domain